MPKDRDGKVSKVYLRVALDGIAPAAGLPPYGALEQVRLVTTFSFYFIAELVTNSIIIGSLKVKSIFL